MAFFYFYSNSNRIVCEQTVENMIRRRILLRLIRFCSVYRCPTKRTLDLYGLNMISIFDEQSKNVTLYYSFSFYSDFKNQSIFSFKVNSQF